jgi:hypothetical protein
MTDNGKSVVIKDAIVIDYVIEGNYVYFMVVDVSENDKIECVKYNIDTQRTTSLYTTVHECFVNVYSHFLKKKDDSYLMIDLRDIIIVIDSNKNTIEKEIVFPKDALYGDINYKGDQLCYYKNGNLYLANTDFSNEKLLKEDVKDTEDTIQPCWSHNDEKIAYFNDYQVEVIDMHGVIHESLPRSARYVKWTRDDMSLLIGANAGGTKIDLKNKIVFTTHFVDDAYVEQGYCINYLDNFSNEVIYSGVNDLLAYKIRTSQWGECDAIGVFDSKYLYVMKESRLPRLVRWTSKENEIAVLYDDEKYQELCIMNVKDDEFKIKDKVICKPLEDNYYLSNNNEIRENGEWIITSEECEDEVVRLNLNTGEQFTVATGVSTVTQSLTKWNYVWSYDGIYLINYNGKEKHHIVSSKEECFDWFCPVDNGLIFRCGNSTYLYDYMTMKTTKIIYSNDYYVNEAYQYQDKIYLNGGTSNQNKIMVYHKNTDQLDEIYRTSEHITLKGLINNTLYFNNKKIDCLTNSVQDCNISLGDDAKLVSWNNKVYIQDGNMVIGYSNDDLKTIHNYKAYNYQYNSNVWYYGKKMYIINWFHKRIYRVNADNHMVEKDYSINDNENLLNEENIKIYLTDDKLLVKTCDIWYEIKTNDKKTIFDEYTGNTEFGEDVLYLNNQLKFQSRKDINKIESIIKESYKVYRDNEDYIVYISNNDKLKVINRKTKNVIVISEMITDKIYLQDHHVYFASNGVGIFRYNILNGITEAVLEGCVHKYIVNDNKLYYIKNYLDNSLHMLNLDNKVDEQITNDLVYVKDLLVVDNELYYIIYDKVPIVYKIDNDKSLFIRILENDYFNRVFPIDSNKIGYAQNNYIMDIISTEECQLKEILYENNNICIFNSYSGGNMEANYVIGYYDKVNDEIIYMKKAYCVEKTHIYDNTLYMIGEEEDKYIIDKIDLKTMVYKNVLKKRDVHFIISDEEYVAYRHYDENNYTLYNIKTEESRELQLDIDIINKIEGGYIYYTNNEKDYSCQINDLT